MASTTNLPGTTTTPTSAIHTGGRPPTFVCHICGGVLVDPVTFPVCLHSVCLVCAEKKLAGDPSLGEIECGFGCGTALKSTSLTVNVDLRSVIGGARLLSDHRTQTPTNGEGARGTREGDLCSLCKVRPASFKCETCGLLCSKHLNKLHSMPAFKAHVVVDLGISSVDIGAISPSRHCILHKKEMELFCKQCNEIICENCWAIGAHRKHECIDIFEARKLLVPQIGSKNEALLSSRRAELMTFRSQLETIKGETESEERNRCNVIKDTITHLHQLLEAKQKELCDFVEREQQVKVHKLEAQRKSINDHISVVECGISFTNMANQRVSDKDPFSFVSLGTVAIHATTLVSQFPSGSALVPSASARLEEAPLDGSHLATAIRDLTLLPPADASQSKLVEADTGPIFIRKDTTVVATIQTCDKTGKPSAYTSELTCSCKGPGNEVPAKIWVVENPENKGSGHLIVRMTPCEHGDYTLTAQINNTHIVGSPLTIFVADTKSAFPGSKILTTLELDNKLHEMVVDAEGAMGHRMINAKWRLLWRGSDHGFAAAKFHERCDNVAPTISIITVSPNYIFGGYTNIPYCSREGDIGGCGGHTFVYSLVYSGTKTGTIQKCTNHRSCIYFRPDWGPTYNCNGIDLVIHDNCNIRPFSTSGLALNSWAQPPPPNGIDKYVAGLHRFLVSNIEVWTPTQRS